MSRLTRDGTAEPVSRDKFSGTHGDRGIFIFPVQLTTSRIGNLTRLIHTLLYVMTIHTVTAGKCNWRHSGWSARLVGFPQCYLTCRFLTNKIFYLIQVWVVFQNEKEDG